MTLLYIRSEELIRTMEYNIRKYHQKPLEKCKYTIDRFIGVSPAAEICRKQVEIFSQMNSTVFITGESGTGKEILAQSIHAMSPRRNGAFVAINCTTPESTLLNSELFGYEEGSFTGARKGGKCGLIEISHGGTLFLDEIGSISLELQAKLLRTIQEKEVRRIGSDKPVPIDVRFIAATNSNLKEKICKGEFRLDLYYRRCVLEINIPPLRERKQDIIPLIKFFCKEFQFPIEQIPESAISWMMKYPWPGNVRELRNTIERISLLLPYLDIKDILHHNADIGQVSAYTRSLQKAVSDNSETALQKQSNDSQKELHIKIGSLKDMERDIIGQLSQSLPNRSELAEALGISRATLWKKLKDSSETENMQISTQENKP